jgi:hypothetical protein
MRGALHRYEVRRKNKSSLEDIASFITEKYNGESGIIYCFSRSECERITDKLRVRSSANSAFLSSRGPSLIVSCLICCYAHTIVQHHNLSISYYHAGMEADERARVQGTGRPIRSRSSWPPLHSAWVRTRTCSDTDDTRGGGASDSCACCVARYQQARRAIRDPLHSAQVAGRILPGERQSGTRRCRGPLRSLLYLR